MIAATAAWMFAVHSWAAEKPDLPAFREYLRESAVPKATIDLFLQGPSWAQFDPELGYILGSYLPQDGLDGSASRRIDHDHRRSSGPQAADQHLVLGQTGTSLTFFGDSPWQIAHDLSPSCSGLLSAPGALDNFPLSPTDRGATGAPKRSYTQGLSPVWRITVV